MKALPYLALSSLAVSTMSGCLITTDDDDSPTYVSPIQGTLTVEWTIGGSTDADQCFQGSASDIDIIVTTGTGDFYGEYLQDCVAFATSIHLPAGTYDANAALVDSSGTARTTSVDTGPFNVHGGDEVSVPVDFPASSFF
jgi:hypothetical protein